MLKLLTIKGFQYAFMFSSKFTVLGRLKKHNLGPFEIREGLKIVFQVNEMKSIRVQVEIGCMPVFVPGTHTQITTVTRI